MTETPSPASNVRTLTMVTHLSALSGLFIPFGNIIGPLVVWLLKRDEMPEVDAHGKAALNFQISLALVFGLAVILLSATIILIPVAWIVGFVGFLAYLWFTIKAGIKANEGILFQYPFSYSFLK